jgi:hypothetical protein
MFTKKRFGLILGLVALALAAVPAVASAHTLTNPDESDVATNTHVFAGSENAVTITTVGELDCEYVEISGNVITNSGGVVTIGDSGTGDHKATNCVRRTPLGEEEVEVTPTFKHLHVDTDPNTTDYAEFTYVLHLPAAGLTCNFAGKVDVSVVGEGTFLQIEGGIGGTSPEPCPKGGNFSGTFELFNNNGMLTVD